jgi:hypothetical protein
MLYYTTEKLKYKLYVILYNMQESEKILIGNTKEYWKNALLAEKNQEFNTSVTLFFKTLSALSDIYILRNEKQLPSSHSNRFRILETKYPDIYHILDKDFPFYQDSYRSKLDKETSNLLKEDVKKLSKILGIEL